MITLTVKSQDSLCRAKSLEALRDANNGNFKLYHIGLTSPWDTNRIILWMHNISLIEMGDTQRDGDFYTINCYQKKMDSIIRVKFSKEILTVKIPGARSVNFKDEFFFLTDSTTSNFNKKLFISTLNKAGLKINGGLLMIYLCKNGKAKIMMYTNSNDEENKAVRKVISKMTFLPWIIGHDTINSIMILPRKTIN